MKRILPVMASKHGIIISVGPLIRLLDILFIFSFSEESEQLEYVQEK